MQSNWCLENRVRYRCSGPATLCPWERADFGSERRVWRPSALVPLRTGRFQKLQSSSVRARGNR